VGKREFYSGKQWVVMNTVGYGIRITYPEAGSIFFHCWLKDKKEGHHPNFMLFPKFIFSLRSIAELQTVSLFINGNISAWIIHWYFAVKLPLWC
jgi:hypothetical protein